MKHLIFICIVFLTHICADSLESLLSQYENTTQNSLRTVDEKLGHVVVYSQKDIRLMQYDTLDDILRELPRMNLNKNRFGVNSPSLSGTNTSVSGFFRFFINDHEISSVHTQSAAVTWGDIPLDFVDYIEVYYGNSSFTAGSDTGVYFIRIYTKKANKINGGEIIVKTADSGSHAQSFMHSFTLKNGWSYLFFANKNSLNDSTDLKTRSVNNDSTRQYVFLDLSNESTTFNLAYSDINKTSYFGMSKDLSSNDGELKSKSIYLDVTKYLLDDDSLKLNASYDRNDRYFYEYNDEGLSLVPIRNPFHTAYNVLSYKEDLTLEKSKLYLSKEFDVAEQNILVGLNYSNKKYKVKNREYTEKFIPLSTITHYSKGHFYDFDEENIYSFLLQDEYRIWDELSLIGNVKFDRYERAGNKVEDSTEHLYRGGFIYTPFENFGLKGFYNKTYVPPTFYNIDFIRTSIDKLKTQKYTYYTLEGVYTTENSKVSFEYDNVKIKNFVYLTPVGFINIDDVIRTKGFTFNYEYLFSQNDKLHLNYFVTTLNQTGTNSDRGGYAKYMGKIGNLEYFTSLVYRNHYYFHGMKVSSSADMSLGATYNFTHDVSLSLKGENLFDKSAQSVFSDAGTNIALKDRDRNVILTLKWVF